MKIAVYLISCAISALCVFLWEKIPTVWWYLLYVSAILVMIGIFLFR